MVAFPVGRRRHPGLCFEKIDKVRDTVNANRGSDFVDTLVRGFQKRAGV